MMYFRNDGWVKSPLGQAIAGAQIYVCSQPADVAFLPPMPEVQLYADPAGVTPLAQPVITDGFGHYDFYVPYGTYTVVVVNGGNIQQVYPDQTIGFTSSGGGGAVSSVFGRTGDVVAQAGDYSAFFDPLGAAAAAVVGLAPLANPSFIGTIQVVNAVITGTLKDGGGSVGTSGQLLSSTGTGTAWVTGGGGGSGTVASGTKGQIGFYASNGDTISGFSNAVFYPETYGAVGNGSTDDTTAIQNTINAAASAGGGIVQFGAKTYLITATLTITASNVCLAGVVAGTPAAGGPSGSILTCNSASVDMINVGNGGAQVHANLFYNFCLTRSVAPTTGNGFVLDSVVDAKLNNIWVFDSIFCFYHKNAQFNTYTNCYAEWTTTSNGITGYGFKMVGTNTTGFFSTRVLEGIVINKAASGTFYGMHISTSGNGVADLYCDGFETAGTNYGIYIDGASSNFNENLHFLRTIHDANTVSCIYITGLNGKDSFVEINGGYASPIGSGAAIDIENSAGVIVSNVNFLALNGGSGPCVLLNGSNSKNNIIQSNVFYCGNSAQVMIKLDNANNNNVSDNTIIGSAANFTAGISLLSSSFNTIEGNTFSGGGTTGISLDASSSKNGGVNVVDPTSITTPLSDAGTGNFVTIAASGGSSDFVKITEIVVGSAVPTVTFSSIPATYRNLKLVVTGRTDAAGTDYTVTFNGDTGANYQAVLAFNGSGAGASATFSQNSAAIGSTASSSAPANQAGVSEIMVYDYAGTTFFKSVTGMTHRLDGVATAYIIWYAATWNSTSAINTIALAAGAGNFVTGSTFTLYGMK